MDAAVDLPVSGTVVITAEGDKYHRRSDLPWTPVSCPTEPASSVSEIPRLEAERREYGPCLRPACFGESP